MPEKVADQLLNLEDQQQIWSASIDSGVNSISADMHKIVLGGSSENEFADLRGAKRLW